MFNILIAVFKTRDDERFLASFDKFKEEANKKYRISFVIQNNRPLVEAQNEVASLFLDNDFDYLLLLDDDHWGHSVEMLDCLIGANTNMATIRTYSRHYPYVTAAWNYINDSTTIPIENGNGYVKCDLTGFPMTLVSRETFSLIGKPYFRSFKDGSRDWHSDVDFCKRLRNIGIKPIVCFQYCLNHDKITQDNVMEYRHKEIVENNGIGWMQVLKQSFNQVQGESHTVKERN